MPLLSCQEFIVAVSFCGMILFIGKTTSPNECSGFLWLQDENNLSLRSVISPLYRPAGRSHSVLQIGGGIFPQLLRHFRLLGVQATEALLVEQRLGQRV
jgi:hypothetical protein